jgi:hypothetical protein
MRGRILAWLVVGVVLVSVGASVAAPPGGGPGAAGDGPRLMRGEVTKISEARGTLMLKTAEGDLELQLPPSVVKGIKKGDHLTVRVGVRSADGGQRHAGPGGGGSSVKSP